MALTKRREEKKKLYGFGM